MVEDFYGKSSDLRELIHEEDGNIDSDLEAEEWPDSPSLQDYSSGSDEEYEPDLDNISLSDSGDSDNRDIIETLAENDTVLPVHNQVQEVILLTSLLTYPTRMIGFVLYATRKAHIGAHSTIVASTSNVTLLWITFGGLLQKGGKGRGKPPPAALLTKTFLKEKCVKSGSKIVTRGALKSDNDASADDTVPQPATLQSVDDKLNAIMKLLQSNTNDIREMKNEQRELGTSIENHQRVQLAATNRMDWPARRCHTTAAAARHGWRIVADKLLRYHN
ncbi:hypothetical protein J6590_061323 [Homalodisca vitripennis]|nr:hypothetical protein J6590_061323 [Homalodisca vitripennis]